MIDRLERLTCLCILLAHGGWGARDPVTIDSLLAARDETAGHVTSRITWAPGGDQFILNERGALIRCDVKSGREHEILKLSKLDEKAVKGAPALVFDWSNRRVGERNVQWFADERRIMVAASGDLFVVDIARGTFDALTQTPEAERDPKLSPDNKRVSFRRGPDLYVMDVASKVVSRLTTNGSETLLNGQLDWVYPEELYLGSAHWWSPDSQWIGYLQFDISKEPVFPQVSLLSSRGLLEPERYPKAGDPNADVKLGVISAAGGSTRWIDTGDSAGSLVARVVWMPDSRQLLVERLNRVQNKLDWLLAETDTGTSRSVAHDEDRFWINVQEEPFFLGRSNRFVWTSERSGFRHIYDEKQLTSGPWEVSKIEGIDLASGRIFFTSTEDSPLGRQLYAIDSDGSNKHRVSAENGTHTVSLAPGGAYYIDDFSSLTERPRSTLHRADGSVMRVFREARRNADEPELPPTEIVSVKTSDGTLLYGRLIKPAGFKPGFKYPAIVIVYGGPGVQQVHDAWQGTAWDHLLAQKGFVVWQLDNRGSAGRGHKFESVVYHNLGLHELEDQKRGIEYLISLGFVDSKRIGMYGWSYGGFMTLYTVTHAPGLIKAAIAGAPVTNWRNYDSIYTERYMGLPADDEDAYSRSSPQTKAAEMGATKLLIVHNLEDDNVHFQNTLQMANALENAGKLFYMLVYPEKSHGVTGPPRRHLLEEATAFFEENLK